MAYCSPIPVKRRCRNSFSDDLLLGNTALHYASCSGHVDAASELIAAGARVEETNENGHTPLMEAATAGHVDVATLLLASGANINMHSTEFKESALTLACYKGMFYLHIIVVVIIWSSL